jgi:hypothetical protein
MSIAVGAPFGERRRTIVRVPVRKITSARDHIPARRAVQRAGIIFAAVALSFSAGAADKKPKAPVTGSAGLWTEPSDVAARDLYYGIGGKEHEPQGPFTFVKEDLAGTNPKFVVKDRAGTKWKVKLGLEARPETTATRLVWAAGYFTSEDYFVPEMQVSGMPEHLKRGQELIGPGGAVQKARLKREPAGDKKLGEWKWSHNEFTGTRELNGLRTMMALINNWDLKDENNAIYRAGSRNIFMVSDLGATFGTDGRSWPRERAKDNLDSYRNSVFIAHVHANTVDFGTPGRPNFEYIVNPKEYTSRIHLEPLGKNIPRADAKWLGDLLMRLSDTQIRDAFRAGGYSPDEIEGFWGLLRKRIMELTAL